MHDLALLMAIREIWHRKHLIVDLYMYIVEWRMDEKLPFSMKNNRLDPLQFVLLWFSRLTDIVCKPTQWPLPATCMIIIQTHLTSHLFVCQLGSILGAILYEWNVLLCFVFHSPLFSSFSSLSLHQYLILTFQLAVQLDVCVIASLSVYTANSLVIFNL